MKAEFALIALGTAFLFGCGNSPEPGEEGSIAPASRIDPGLVTGYYSNVTVTDADESFGTEMWVRKDSTFVLRVTKPEGDAFPLGTVGHWSLQDGRLMTRSVNGTTAWQRTASGLETVAKDAAMDPRPVSLTRMQGLPVDEVPVMRLHGRYRFANGSHSFEPDGSGLELPFGVGDLAADMEQVYNGRADKSVGHVCVEVECLLTRGPAQEGEGTVEYAILFQFNSTLPASECR